jgi:hypothetical protein
MADSLPKVGSIDQYWLEGEKKIYSFTVDGVEIGRLEAIMDDIYKKNGRVYCDIEEKLTLDFSLREQGYIFGVDGQLTVSGTGYFRSGEIDIRVDDREENIRLAYDASAKQIVIRRGDEEQATRSIDAPRPVFALDNYMIDQFEIALATHSLEPGKTIIIPGLSIQRIYTAEHEFHVLGKVQIQYGAFIDSVWQVDMLRPAQSSIYIDRKHRIVKLVDSAQDIVAEMIIDPFAERRAPQKSLFERINDQMVRLPIYGIYLLVSVIWLLFLGRGGFGIRWSYLLFILGGLVYPIIYITQAPIQKYYAIQVLAPALAAGESIFVPAVIPALMTGLIQESLKLIPLLIVVHLVKPKPVSLISLGAFIGAGFGFVEASHIIAPMFQERLLTGYILIERVFTVLSHTIMGALLGYGIARKKIWQFWLAAAGLHGLGNYLIIFVQLKILTIKGLNIIIGLYDIALLGGMIYLRRDFKRDELSSKKARK